VESSKLWPNGLDYRSGVNTSGLNPKVWVNETMVFPSHPGRNPTDIVAPLSTTIHITVY